MNSALLALLLFAAPEAAPAWSITLTPHASASVVWGKIEMRIDSKRCMPVEQRFFDEDQQLARRMTYGDLQTIGWRTYPMKLTVSPADQGRQTVITSEHLELDVP